MKTTPTSSDSIGVVTVPNRDTLGPFTVNKGRILVYSVHLYLQVIIITVINGDHTLTMSIMIFISHNYNNFLECVTIFIEHIQLAYIVIVRILTSTQ